MHQVRGCREKESGDGNGEEQNERQQVIGELLHGTGIMIAATSPEGEENTDQNHHGGDIKNVEGQLGHEAPEAEAADRNAEHEGAIDFLIVARSLEIAPTRRRAER